MSSSLYYERR
jgi:hypothetical protein